ncbi:MAG: serine hydrolase [Candidatus Brocadiae bacterium]|nr:serine hydrolase [Candidatus Brocadiia bacterium]
MVALLLATLFACPPLEGELDAASRHVAALICENPSEDDIDGLFTAEFLAQVPAPRLRQMCIEMWKRAGAVTGIERVETEGETSGQFAFRFTNGAVHDVTLSVEAKKPHRIHTLWIGPPRKFIDSLDAVAAELKTLPGTVSFCVRRLGDDPGTIASHNAGEPLAIGSAFKLYVLGALAASGRKPDETVALREDWKSLPSGVLHTWPAGTPLTLQSLAVQMISISDNTATDHLLHALGRKAVEEMLAPMGNAHADRSVPFLSTLELFKLRSSPRLRRAWLKADGQGRRAMLEKEVRDYDRAKVKVWTKPGAISRIEWFASADDLCSAMEWFRTGNSPAALEALSVNRGLRISRERFPWCGFKGGSEPGVVNMTYLLRRADGAWFALACTWNNPDAPVDETRLFGLVQAAIDVLGRAEGPGK